VGSCVNDFGCGWEWVWVGAVSACVSWCVECVVCVYLRQSVLVCVCEVVCIEFACVCVCVCVVALQFSVRAGD